MHTIAELKGAKSYQGVWCCKILRYEAGSIEKPDSSAIPPTSAEGRSLPFPIPFKHVSRSAYQASPDVGIIGIDGITIAAYAHVVVTKWQFQGRDGR